MDGGGSISSPGESQGGGEDANIRMKRTPNTPSDLMRARHEDANHIPYRIGVWTVLQEAGWRTLISALRRNKTRKVGRAGRYALSIASRKESREEVRQCWQSEAESVALHCRW